MTMTLVSSTTLSVAATNITFSSIPQTGTDLLLVLSARRSGGAVTATSELFFNNDTTISGKLLTGNGSTASSSSASAFITVSNGASSNSSTFSSYVIYIPNYTGSASKTFSIDAVTETMATGASQYLIGGVWNNTAAIDSVKFDAGDTFVAGTSASLYTITKGSGGASVA